MLETLSDGKWHTQAEIQQETRLKNVDVEKIIKFLKDYNFIMVEEKENKIKLNGSFRKLMLQTA
ncbi:hypothetical protein KEJ45_02745 [Candidatus Bathyarchaeota archaeon]|nr:hypothetical protein [Candidatus Bathyarchaeota archaeon]